MAALRPQLSLLRRPGHAAGHLRALHRLLGLRHEPAAGLAHHHLRPLLRRRRDPFRPGHGPDADDPHAQAVSTWIAWSRIDHFDKLAQTMLVTTAIMGYSYVVEPFIAWYSGDLFEQQFALWRATPGTGWPPRSTGRCSCSTSSSRCPHLRARPARSLPWLFFVSIAVDRRHVAGALLIIVRATAHDFMPHNWGQYVPSWVEISITLGSACFFFFWFLVFSQDPADRSVADLKSQRAEEAGRRSRRPASDRRPDDSKPATSSVLAVYGEADKLRPGASRPVRRRLPPHRDLLPGQAAGTA